MGQNGITANSLGVEGKDDKAKGVNFTALKSRIANSLVTEDISGLQSDEEINIYNEVRDKTKFDTFKSAAGGRVSGDTVKFFGAEVQDLFDKFETNVGSSDTGKDDGQKATTTDFANKEEFNEAILAKQIVPDKEYSYMQNGVLKTKTFSQDEVNEFYNTDDKDDSAQASSTGTLSEEAFNALPPDVGNPPGTALSPSGKTRDDRNEWFAKYGKTHNRNGIKKTYTQYVADMTPSKRRSRR